MPFSLLKPTQSITTLGTTLFFYSNKTLWSTKQRIVVFLLLVKT